MNAEPAPNLVYTSVPPDYSETIYFDIPSESGILEGGGRYRISVWECVDLSWWAPVWPEKVVQVLIGEAECEAYGEVLVEYHECYSPEGFDYEYRDQDGDGFSIHEGDCDEGDPTVGDDANEDGVSDCVDVDGDGYNAEEGDCDESDPFVVSVDNDNDATSDCVDDDRDGYTELQGDCDDEDPANIPEDLDGDGTSDCDDFDRDGYSELEGDCNDLSGSVFPDAPELCDGRDNDCDGEMHETGDLDGDGFTTCASLDVPADCDDDNAEVNPDADEVCDHLDNNCDGEVDEGLDNDLDGSLACDEVPDCNDHNAEMFPGNLEVCDGLDNDCNTFVDDGLAPETDELEPNSDVDDAQQVDVVGSSPVTMTGTLETPEDEDWFMLVPYPDLESAPPERTFTVALEGIPMDADYDLYVYRLEADETTEVARSTNPGPIQEAATFDADPVSDANASYLVRLVSSSHYSFCDAYLLTLSSEDR